MVVVVAQCSHSCPAPSSHKVIPIFESNVESCLSPLSVQLCTSLRNVASRFDHHAHEVRGSSQNRPIALR